MSKIKIIIVEDHTILRETLALSLNFEESFDVVGHWRDAESVLERLDDLQFDVAVIDKILPGMDGLGFTIRLKELRPDVKVVMLTMSDNEKNILMAFEAGASAYLLKEISTPELIQAIKSVMNGEEVLSPGLTKRLIEYQRRESHRARLIAESRPELSQESIAIIGLVSKGHCNKEISRKMNISLSKVKGFLQEIYTALNVHDRAHAVTVAMKKGIITEEQC